MSGRAPTLPGIPELLVQLTASDLRSLVADAVTTALAEFEAEQPPALLDVDGLCHALGCSRTTLHRLRVSGLPTLRLLDSPRFELPTVLEWLRSRSSDSEDFESNGSDAMAGAESASDGAAVLLLQSTDARKLRQLTPAGRRGR